MHQSTKYTKYLLKFAHLPTEIFEANRHMALYTAAIFKRLQFTNLGYLYKGSKDCAMSLLKNCKKSLFYFILDEIQIRATSRPKFFHSKLRYLKAVTKLCHAFRS